MFRRLGLLAGAAVIASAASAAAQPVNGLYVGGGLGTTWLAETNQSIFPPVSTDLSTPSNHFRRTWNAGPVALGSLGWGFGNGLRTELELAYRQNDASGGGLLFSRPASGGRAQSLGVFANVFYDFDLGVVMPYVGGGIGYSWTRWSSINNAVAGTQGTYGLSVDSSAGGFAYQAIAGLAVPIRSIPGLAVGIEYRYTASSQIDLSGTLTGPGTRTSITVLPATSTQNVLLTVRYNFGQARPAPPAVATPAPARSFLVFFDFASDRLTDRAREILGQAAQAARTQQVTRIEVAGHTDTVGSARYNQGLSIRRANNVAAELVRQGVPRNAIHTAGYGFTRPLVPTGPNVREPQNRRVEIVLR